MSNKRFSQPFSPTREIPGLTPTFNPKKHTEECRNPPPKRKLPTGPFIDHCNDTYTGGVPLEIHMKRQAQIQMSRRTVRNLKASRAVMLILRVFLVFACVGLLTLLISMRNIDMITGWITRVPPAVAGLHGLYSIYHYARSSRERTPGSSASYAMFACATDCCLIPFFVLSCLYSHRELGLLNSGAEKLWVSAIGPPSWINKLIFSIFVLSASAGGIILLAVFLGFFIAVTYRRIARLPPDMNPLDDRAFMGMLAKADANTKRWSSSTVDSLDKEKPQRQIPFLQTRTKNGSVEWEYSEPLVPKEREDGINDWARSSRRNTFVSADSSKRVSFHQDTTPTLGAAADAMKSGSLTTTISANTSLPRLPPAQHKKNMSAGGNGNTSWNGHSAVGGSGNHPPGHKLQNRNTICFATPTSMGSVSQGRQQEPMQRATFDVTTERPTRNSHQYPSFINNPGNKNNSNSEFEAAPLTRVDSGNMGKPSRQKTASSKHRSLKNGITGRLPTFKSTRDEDSRSPIPRGGYYEPLDSTSGDYNDDDDDGNWVSHENDDDYKFHSLSPPQHGKRETKSELRNTYYFDDGDNAEHHHDFVDSSLSAQKQREYGNDDVEIDADVLAHALNVRMEAMHLPKIEPLNTGNKVRTTVHITPAKSNPSTPTSGKKKKEKRVNSSGGDSTSSTPSKSGKKGRKYGLLGGSSSPKPSPTKNMSPTKVGARSTSNTGADNGGQLPVLNLRLRNVSGSGVV